MSFQIERVLQNGLKFEILEHCGRPAYSKTLKERNASYKGLKLRMASDILIATLATREKVTMSLKFRRK